VPYPAGVDLDSAADELYGLAPEEFVARRTALERAARADGDSGLANRIRRLGRPTRSAWLINLLSREHPETVEQLLDLADLLAEGMRTMSAPELQTLTRQRAQLVSSITRTALAIGHERGHRAGGNTRAEVADTLTAALADPQVAEQVRTGRLSRAATWSGLGLPGASDAPARSRTRSTGADEPPVAQVVELEPHRRRSARTRARRRRDRAAEDRRRAEEAVTRSATRVAEAQERTDRARKELDPARDALQRAEAALAEAERAAQRARREHDRATEALGAEQDRLGRTRDEDEHARTRLAEATDELTAAEQELAALDDQD